MQLHPRHARHQILLYLSVSIGVSVCLTAAAFLYVYGIPTTKHLIAITIFCLAMMFAAISVSYFWMQPIALRLEQVVRDIRKRLNRKPRKESELDSIEHYVKQMSIAADEQAASLEHQTDILSIASHQLRTPLNNVKWILDSLQKGKVGSLKSDQQELIGDAIISIERMKHVVSSMLTLTSIEKETFNLHGSNVDIHAVLDGAVKSYDSEVSQKKQHVHIRCTKQLTLETDENILSHIIDNLLGNAVKYTPPEGKILLEAKRKSGSVQLKIADSGYGIPYDQQEKIFSKFFRADTPQAKQIKGTGLGLHIVKTLLAIIGGEIHFTSKENKGTTFTILLPLTLPSS